MMYRKGNRQKEIAEAVGVSQAAISKELSRNRSKRGHYHYQTAQEYAQERKVRYHYKRKFTKVMEAYIRDKMENWQWSPEEIVGAARKEGTDMVGKSRIYQYIRADKEKGGDLWRHCRHRLKHRRRPVGATQGPIPNRVSIHDRPPEVQNRQEFGHWEMDLIESADRRQYLLTLVERQTRYTEIRKVPTGKKAKDVAQAVCLALLPYKGHIKSITTDNGGEFAAHKTICKRFNTTVYFADPYSSWQKGTVENTNKLIRQYIPKNTNFANLTNDDIRIIKHKLNTRPRKVINFDKPYAAFFPKLKKI
jgi:IS30 family transposase